MNTHDHVRLAKHVKRAYHLALSAACDVATKEQLSDLLREFREIKHQLDTHYHAVTSDADFETLGHVYYGLVR